MKNANGYGSVYKLKGRRSRPWTATVSVGRTQSGKLIRRNLGYYPTKKDAQTALGVYNAAPYSLERLTFRDIYERWSAERFPRILQVSAQRYINAFNRSRPLHRRRFDTLRTLDLENVIRSSGAPVSTQQAMRALYVAMYQYALRYDFALRNYAENIQVAPLQETEKRRPFTDAEIRFLFDHSSDRIAQHILIGIYSGWRCSELCTFRLDGDLMQGGVKTKSGRDRIVPVHKSIEAFVSVDRYTLGAYRQAFKKYMDRLGWVHTPHDTRRTFATLASRAGMNEHIRKLIMGHAETDLTERYYTSHTVDELRQEMAKIPLI